MTEFFWFRCLVFDYNTTSLKKRWAGLSLLVIPKTSIFLKPVFKLLQTTLNEKLENNACRYQRTLSIPLSLFKGFSEAIDFSWWGFILEQKKKNIACAQLRAFCLSKA